MISTITHVLRGEGAASAARRAGERIGEALHGATLRMRGMVADRAAFPILNVSAAGASGRLGGVQVQLRARLRHERALRNVALLHPGALELSAPFLHTRRMPAFGRTRELVSPAFETAVLEAMTVTGARTLHFEGTDGLPLGSVLRLAESGIGVVLSVHDFSLFCARPHLLELPSENFCFYSEDLERCGRCLRETWDVTSDQQADRRRVGRRLLAAAKGVIFPSRYLHEEHRRLFSLPRLTGEVVEPGVAANGRELPVHETRPAVAWAGSVKRHKGGHLIPDLVRLAGRATRWHVFGGGDADLLRAARAPNVTVHGYYRPGRLPSLLALHQVGLVVLGSIVPETFGLVLSEAWQARAAVAAFDLGAPAERIGRHGGGWLAPLESGATGLAGIVQSWVAGRIAVEVPPPVPTSADAAAAHLERYHGWGLT
jgi:glycosyltransferase involved in cell wall biosynthesis